MTTTIPTNTINSRLTSKNLLLTYKKTCKGSKQESKAYILRKLKEIAIKDNRNIQFY